MDTNESEYSDNNSIDYNNDNEEDEIIYINKGKKKHKKRNKKIKIFNQIKTFFNSFDIFFLVIVLLIIYFCISSFISSLREYNNIEQEEKIFAKINQSDLSEINSSQKQGNLKKNIDLIKLENNTNAKNESNEQKQFINEEKNKFIFNSTNKLKIAFVYKSLYANGIARFVSVTANNFIKTGKYEIYVITEFKSPKDYKLDNRINRLIAKNRTIIKNLTKNLNIDFFILQNDPRKGIVNYYKTFCKKVIGMFHGVFMSAMFHGVVGGYKTWNQFDDFDSFIFIGYDDYFFYKGLGFKNAIFVPNLYTFDPSEIKSSNLTGHNIVMLGRAADKVKGYYWAIKTMSLIVKEVPDAKLIILSSNPKIDFLKDYAKNISVYDNIIFNQYTANITEVFWNSSILMYTSLSEAFPLAMVEGKAHGLPVVAFDVAYSPPYQSGVIGVDMLDCEALAKETVKLLKDYEYRKKMGEESKLSLNQFKNEETIKLWERLFTSLLEGESSYRKLQKEIEEKYYDEKKARERMEKRFRDLVRYNKNFTCHSIINFTDINYIKNVKMCPFNETKKTDNKSSENN